QPHQIAARTATSEQLISSITHVATTAVDPLSLHDALPIFILGTFVEVQVLHSPSQYRVRNGDRSAIGPLGFFVDGVLDGQRIVADRKSTRLNSSHVKISYAVCCLNKKNSEGRHVCRGHALH